jgi:hypothetical protein
MDRLRTRASQRRGRLLTAVSLILGICGFLVAATPVGASTEVPSAPSVFGAFPGNAGAQIFWTVPSSDGGSPITKYVVTPYANGTPGTPTDIAVASLATFTASVQGPSVYSIINGLENGTNYSFTVAAENASGTGPPSAVAPESGVTPTLPSPPYQVTNLSASVETGDQYEVSWTVPPDNGSPITSFEITPWFEDSLGPTVSVAAGAPGSATDSTPGATDHALVDDHLGQSTYQFAIAAVNGAGIVYTTMVLTNEVSGAVGESTSDLTFGNVRVGSVAGPTDITIQNNYQSDIIHDFTLTGADAGDFTYSSDCGTLAETASCTLKVNFKPSALGARSATITPDDSRGSAYPIALNGTGTEGYYEATAAGLVYPHGDGMNWGGLSGTHLSSPIVGIASMGGSGSYWLVASDGGVFSFGLAQFYGSTGAIVLNKPIVGMAATPDGGGYWLVASDGGIFSFGDAHFYGSTGGIHLNKPIVGMASTPDGGGYWLVASDGGIFSFGDAHFYGSTGAIALYKPIVGMAAAPDGGGYWLMASDGGVFTFGDAPFYGSTEIQTPSVAVGFAGTAPPAP